MLCTIRQRMWDSWGCLGQRLGSIRFRRGEIPSGIWDPVIFKKMKKPTELSKEYIDFLLDGTCRTPMNFGIHEGTPLGALPTDYLVWLSNDFRSDTINWRWWRDVAREVLKERQSVHIGKRREFITALIRAGNVDYSLELLKTEANQVDLPPGYAALIIYCRDHKALEQGIKVHNQITWSGYSRNSYLSELLMQMYSRCDMLDLAKQVFDGLPKKLISTWTTYIRCHVEHSKYKEAIELYKKMDLEPDQQLLIVMFDCCAKANALAEGKVIHACLHSSEVRTDLPLRTAIFEFYARCGAVDVAGKLFLNLEKKKVETWNLMMGAYAKHGLKQAAYGTYQKMGRTKNAESFILGVGACESLEQVRSVESEFLKSKISTDPGVRAAIDSAKEQV